MFNLCILCILTLFTPNILSCIFLLPLIPILSTKSLTSNFITYLLINYLFWHLNEFNQVGWEKYGWDITWRRMGNLLMRTTTKENSSVILIANHISHNNNLNKNRKQGSVEVEGDKGKYWGKYGQTHYRHIWNGILKTY